MPYPVSVAGVYHRSNDNQFLCSVCFFAAAADREEGERVNSFLSTRVLKDLAMIVPVSNPSVVEKAVLQSAQTVGEAFGIECQGFLNASALTISSPTTQM